MTMKVIQQTPQILRSGSRMQFVTIVILELLLLEEIYGWTYHYNSEYMSWQNARTFCQQKYTDMVAIQNAEEIEYLNDTLPFARYYYWIGIRKVNNTWIWVGTGKPLNKEAENWAKDEPNNEGKSGNEDCVEMYIKRAVDTGKWNDISCKKKKSPLCYKASCSPKSCSNNGECIETIGNYTCLCNDGFNGPECEHVEQCAILNAPDKGTMVCTHPNRNFSYDSTCEVHCAPGFILQGSQSLKCNASAEWTAELPSCKAIQCAILEDQEQMIMTCSEPLAPFSYNSTCNFSCVEGFELKGSEQLECGATGQWSAVAPQCEAIQCATLEDQEQMTMTCSEPFAPFSYNSTCKFSCAEGFELQGSEQLECGATGQWSAPAPDCEAVQCAPLEDQEQVIMTCSEPLEPFSYNSTCNFSCAEGFELQGSEQLKCGATGQWSAAAPHCEAVQCENLEKQDQVIMTCSETFRYSSTCSFSCQDGFALSGASRIECAATGQWTAPVPTCQAVKCGVLEVPENGKIHCSHPMDNLRYRSVCSFDCLLNYSLNGSVSLECDGSGQWSSPIPTCEDSNPQAIHENSTPIIISSAVASGISVLTLIAWIVRQLRKKAQGKKFSLLSKEEQKASGTYKLNEEV